MEKNETGKDVELTMEEYEAMDEDQKRSIREELIGAVERIASGFACSANPESGDFDAFVGIVTAGRFSEAEWQILKHIGNGNAPYSPVEAEDVPNYYDWDYVLDDDAKKKYGNDYHEYVDAMDNEAGRIRDAVVEQAQAWIDIAIQN